MKLTTVRTTLRLPSKQLSLAIKLSVNTTRMKLFKRIDKMFQKPISLTFIRSFIRSFVYEEIQQCDALTISMDNNVRSKLTFSFLVKSFNFPLPFIIHKQLNMSSLLSRRGVNLRCRKMNA